MDNLTHAMVGAALARAGLGRKLEGATLLCVVAANAPDIDVVVGTDLYLAYHRHLTHAVAAIPLMAALAVWLTWALQAAWRRLRGGPSRQRAFWAEWRVALVAAATHPLLDLMNSYGVRLWLPFSGEWTSWDALFVIDPFVWAILAVALAAPVLLRLARSGGGTRTRRAAAWAGLLGLSLYIGVNRHWHDRLLAALDARLYDGRPALRTAVFPAPFDPRSWVGYVETPDYVLTIPLHAGDERAPSLPRGTKHERAADPRAVETAWESPIGRSFARFARYPLTWVEREGRGAKVTLGDFRFLRLGRSGLACTVRLDSAYRVVEERFDF